MFRSLLRRVASGSSAAFSLVEMSVTLVIIASVVGMSASIGSTQLTVMDIRGTESNLELAENALNLFQKKSGRYPCPALLDDAPGDLSTYGIETADCTSNCSAPGITCTDNVITGFLPFKSLGIAEEAAYDAWDQRLTYSVDRNHTVHSEYEHGSIPVLDNAGNEITESPVFGDAIYLVVSHGQDGKGAYNRAGSQTVACGSTTLDDENCDNDAVFIDAPLADASETVAANYYNDFMLWHTQDRIDFVPLEESPLNIVFQNNIVILTNAMCIINDSSQLMCAGSDGDEVGAGGVTSTTFIEEANAFGDWVMLSRGDNNSACGLRSNGRAYCWGLNDTGQLGDGTTTDRDTPTEISGGHTDWTFVNVDQYIGCGIRNSGRAYCWGTDTDGVLGNGAAGDSYTPTEVSGGYSDWIAIQPSHDGTCGLRSTGQIYCWGYNNGGALGDGTTTDRDVPTEISGGFTNWSYVHATSSTMRFGLRDTGEVYIWGDWTGIDDPRELHDETGSPGFNDWEYITSGTENFCGIRTGGTLYCLGENGNGAVGNGTSAPAFVGAETLVPGGITDWVAAATSSAHSCAVRANGDLYCWGTNSNGSFGNGSTSGAIVGPTQIVGVTVKTD